MAFHSIHMEFSWHDDRKHTVSSSFFFFSPFIIVVQLQSSPLSPHYSSPPYPPSHIQSYSPSVFFHGSFICVPWWPFPFFPLLSPSTLPSGHCHFVIYYHGSASILLPCLFCWLGTTYRWGHMVFFLHHLAYFT